MSVRRLAVHRHCPRTTLWVAAGSVLTVLLYFVRF